MNIIYDEYKIPRNVGYLTTYYLLKQYYDEW